jgi:hypothetical protein
VQGRQGGVPSTKEVQGKPPGEEQSKYQEHLIKLKQEHHQHHNQLPIEAIKGSRYTLEIAYHEPNHGKNQDSCINKINSKIETPHHQTLLPSAVLRRFWGIFPQTYREVLCIIIIGRFS